MACKTSVLSVVAAPQLNGTNISCYSNEILQYQHVISITSKFNNPYNSLIHSCAFSAIDIGVLVYVLSCMCLLDANYNLRTEDLKSLFSRVPANDQQVYSTACWPNSVEDH